MFKVFIGDQYREPLKIRRTENRRNLFRPELRSDVVTKFLRVGGTTRAEFCLAPAGRADEKFSRHSLHAEYLEVPYKE